MEDCFGMCGEMLGRMWIFAGWDSNGETWHHNYDALEIRMLIFVL